MRECCRHKATKNRETGNQGLRALLAVPNGSGTDSAECWLDELNLPRSRGDQRQVKASNRRMKTVRQFSRVGPCIELGPLIRETETRLYYRCRQGYEAFVSKKSSLAVHLEPCPSRRDHERSQYPNGYWD